MNLANPRTPLVVIGGWGVDAAMLLPLFDRWPGEIHLVSLSNALMSRCGSVDDAAGYLLDRYPCPSVWAGWSQGSQIAMAAAERGGPQVKKVITLAGFPRFVAGPQWPTGMPETTFKTFRAGVSSHTDRTWRRFHNLLIHGCTDESEARRDMLPWLEAGVQVSQENLERGLDWLESEDQTALWRAVTCPALHLQSEIDSVVPSWAGSYTPADMADVVSVPGMTHWPRGHALDACRDSIRRFVFQREGSWLR